MNETPDIISRLDRIEALLSALVGDEQGMSADNEISLARARGLDLAEYLVQKAKTMSRKKRRKVGAHA